MFVRYFSIANYDRNRNRFQEIFINISTARPSSKWLFYFKIWCKLIKNAEVFLEQLDERQIFNKNNSWLSCEIFYLLMCYYFKWVNLHIPRGLHWQTLANNLEHTEFMTEIKQLNKCTRARCTQKRLVSYYYLQ